MLMLQVPQLPKPEDVMDALQRAGAQSINGIFMTLSAPLELVKGLGIPVPEPPKLPNPPAGGKPTIQPSMFGLPWPFAGGEADVMYEPYYADEASEGGMEDVTIESGKKKEIWV